jgi:small subunit ribosomal protein S3
MGQKVHPHGFRVGVNKNWDTRWFANKKDFANRLVEDYNVRTFLKKKLFAAGVSKVEIERASNNITVNIFTSKPGVLIGRGGAGVEILKNDVKRITDGKNTIINVIEIKNPDMDAQLVSENIAAQLEKRTSFRRAMKQAIARSMKSGAKGVKTAVAGRLGGAEIARNEGYHEGSIPLQTLRADIDYGFAEARTTYGRIGVKVWIYKGEIFKKPTAAAAASPKEGGRA